jgi:hypothetical protein
VTVKLETSLNFIQYKCIHIFKAIKQFFYILQVQRVRKRFKLQHQAWHHCVGRQEKYVMYAFPDMFYFFVRKNDYVARFNIVGYDVRQVNWLLLDLKNRFWPWYRYRECVILFQSMICSDVISNCIQFLASYLIVQSSGLDLKKSTSK